MRSKDSSSDVNFQRDSAKSFSSVHSNSAGDVGGKSFYAGRTTASSLDAHETEKPAPVVVRRRHQIIAHAIVESKCFVLFTTILTIYALMGDDFKLMVTDKAADEFFDGMVLTCMVVFTAEVLLSCIGKDDYLFGFFFYLDVVSTFTLVLDFSAVSDMISGNSSDEEETASNMRGGRTARAGARLGRILRVLRLVRIIKLYKTYEEETSKRKKKEQQEGKKPPGEEDDWDDAELKQDEDAKDEPRAESNVGKKLSEMTTRKTILLILALLLLLQGLTVELAEQSADSATYGADNVLASFKVMEESRSGLNSSRIHPGVNYEGLFHHSLLKYIYYHNWFAVANPQRYCFDGREEGCPSTRYSHLFWVGISAPTQAEIDSKLQHIALTYNDMVAWEDAQVTASWNGGYLPDEAKRILSGPWNVRCDSGSRPKLGVSLLSEVVPDALEYTILCPEELRGSEFSRRYARMVTDAEYEGWRFEFYFDERPFSKEQAFLQLMLMLFLLVVLVLWSLMFTYDANRLIVNPVEKMIRNVMSIRDDPLMATKMADNEFKQEEIAKARRKRLSKDKVFTVMKDIISCNFFGTKEEPMETLILEKTIMKLGSLLALGFGEAGANIIRHNMKGQASAMINAMVPGTIVNCIIGICRVRDFSIATEVLQSKINAFVNSIAEIIHGVVDEYHGAPNKNNGETFLVIWRVEQEEMEKTKRMAELSLVAFARILGAIHRSPVLAGYRTHPGLQYRLGNNCRVNVSFGIHAGWAIEGAVGSEFKIDASYLSPHVSVATNIERVTHVYGVSLLATESVIDLCSASIASKCRLIDRLKISGSKDPMKMFCVDLDYRLVKVDSLPPLRIAWNTRNRFKARQFLENEKNAKLNENSDIATIFESDATIQEMRQMYTTEFFQLFNMGYQNYYQGEWQVAKRILLYTRKMTSGVEDGPSSALLRFMEVPHQFEPPSWWDGVRELSAQEIEGSASRRDPRMNRQNNSHRDTIISS